MEDSVASGAEGEFYMRQKRTYFYDGLEALEHDVTSNNGLLWDWWAECPALQVRFPSSARFHLQHVCLQMNYFASSQDVLHMLVPFIILPLSSWKDPQKVSSSSPRVVHSGNFVSILHKTIL